MDISTIKNQIILANKQYRIGEDSGFTDIGFDNLCDSLKSLIPIDEYNDFINSLNEGVIETYGQKITHKYIAGSLNKLKYEEPDTIKKFISKNIKNYLIVSAKVDGLSGILHYNNGKLVGCATRGDGTTGISILDKAQFINGIPQNINTHEDIYIRGELVILTKNYDKITGTSPRNIVAGLINRKEIKSDELKYVDFIAYTVMGPIYTKNEQLSLLKTNNFNVVKYFNINNEMYNTNNIVDFLFNITTLNYDYLIDGLVLCDSEYKNEDKYRPDNQVAFKTNQQTFETRLLDVEWQGPSKDGRMNCLGILEPCDCGGVVVSKCTLHNIDFIKKSNVKIGDEVQITRSGDVIPKFIKVVETNENSVDIEYPKTCPCCGELLIQEGPFLYCKNNNCEDKLRYQVMHFIKKCGVDFASFKTLKNFNISTINDLLNFRANKKYKSEVKLEKEINEKIFTLSDEDIFVKLNMKDIGETLLRKIVDFYGWERIVSEYIDSTYTDIGLPEGIGEITMSKFLENYRENLNYMKLIVNDERYNYKKDEKIMEKVETVGSICFTGVLNTMSRTQASKIAESKGYQIKNSVSKGLTYLVTNDKFSGSSKNKKAQKLGTKIINEDEFLKLMSDNLCDIDEL